MRWKVTNAFRGTLCARCRPHLRAVVLSSSLWWGAFLAQAQYLPTLGPAPLRWTELPPPNPALVASLPPLAIIVPTSEAATGAHSAPTNAVAEPAPLESKTNHVAVAPVPVMDSSASTNPAPVEPMFSGPEVTPLPAFPREALAPFFSASLGTNLSTSVTLPLQFIPPAAPPPPSSSATYSTPKP